MGRARCCEKMGLKKGPWTPEEDQILICYIGLHGHSNWRALPKKAGLLRCGKSCRLRWINYLSPDIKRGNFTQEEEETIFKLHEILGNRWSAIAAKLPGRTDNEIKNIWHTHLKKRLTKQNEQSGSTTTEKRARKSRASKKSEVALEAVSIDNDIDKNHNKEKEDRKVRPISSIECTSEVSNITSTITSENENVSEKDGYTANLSEVNDDFCMEVFSPEDIAMSTEEVPSNLPCHLRISPDVVMADPTYVSNSKVHREEMERFWFNLVTRSSNDLPEFSEMSK